MVDIIKYSDLRERLHLWISRVWNDFYEVTFTYGERIIVVEEQPSKKLEDFLMNTVKNEVVDEKTYFDIGNLPIMYNDEKFVIFGDLDEMRIKGIDKEVYRV